MQLIEQSTRMRSASLAASVIELVSVQITALKRWRDV